MQQTRPMHHGETEQFVDMTCLRQDLRKVGMAGAWVHRDDAGLKRQVFCPSKLLFQCTAADMRQQGVLCIRVYPAAGTAHHLYGLVSNSHCYIHPCVCAMQSTCSGSVHQLQFKGDTICMQNAVCRAPGLQWFPGLRHTSTAQPTTRPLPSCGITHQARCLSWSSS